MAAKRCSDVRRRRQHPRDDRDGRWGGDHARRFAASRGGPAEYPTNAATAMTHITIHETLDGKVVDRMEGGEEVGDEQ
jgi:hypothetical protein